MTKYLKKLVGWLLPLLGSARPITATTSAASVCRPVTLSPVKIEVRILPPAALPITVAQSPDPSEVGVSRSVRLGVAATVNRPRRRQGTSRRPDVTSRSKSTKKVSSGALRRSAVETKAALINAARRQKNAARKAKVLQFKHSGRHQPVLVLARAA